MDHLYPMPPVPAPAQAILFVPTASCLPLSADLKDMSQMILRTKGPDRLPAGYEIVLYISMSDSDKVGVFYVESECPQPGPAAVPARSVLTEPPLGAQPTR